MTNICGKRYVSGITIIVGGCYGIRSLSITRWLSTVRWVFENFPNTADLSSSTFYSIRALPSRFRLLWTFEPWNFRSPSLPPEVEVRVKKTYHYDDEPCPRWMSIQQVLTENCSTVYGNPGPHLDRFWLNVFPKEAE